MTWYDIVVPVALCSKVSEVFGEDLRDGFPMVRLHGALRAHLLQQGFMTCVHLVCSVFQLQALLAASTNATASHVARRCVLSILLAWPPELRCSSKLLGGVDRLISLAKMVAAGEHIFTNLFGSTKPDLGKSSALVEAVRRKMSWLVSQEAVPPTYAGYQWKCAGCGWTEVRDLLALLCRAFCSRLDTVCVCGPWRALLLLAVERG